MAGLKNDTNRVDKNFLDALSATNTEYIRFSERYSPENCLKLKAS